MTVVTLAVNGVTFTFDDGEVNKVSSETTSAVQYVPSSSSGPMTGYNYDQDGVTKRITLTGQLFDAVSTRTSTGTVTTILSQKQWLESLQNGSQKGITFTSNYESQSVVSNSSPSSPYQGSFTSTKVMVESFKVDENSGDPAKVPFTMVLLVGNSVL